jgi:hypothetical protein
VKSREGAVGLGIGVISLAAFVLIPAAQYFGLSLDRQAIAVILIVGVLGTLVGVGIVLHPLWPRPHPVSAEHAQELRGLATQLIACLDQWRPAKFNADPDDDRVSRDVFRSHFGTTFRAIDVWDSLLLDAQNAEVELERHVLQSAGAVAREHSLNDEQVRAVLRKSAASAGDPAAGPPNLLIQPTPKWGIGLLLGGSFIGQYPSVDVAQRAKAALEWEAADTQTWPEVPAARRARERLDNHRKTLRVELTEISRRHRITGQCRLCGGR